MIKSTIVDLAVTMPTSTLTKTLVDGASLYVKTALGNGRLTLPLTVISSQGLIFPYGQGAPAWGDWEMYSDGVVGVDFDLQWDLTGASSPTTYEVLSGDLPDGLTLESVAGNTGRIYGTPTVADTFNFTLRATNSYGTADQAFSIVIVTPAGASGGAYTFIG